MNKYSSIYQKIQAVITQTKDKEIANTLLDIFEEIDEYLSQIDAKYDKLRSELEKCQEINKAIAKEYQALKTEYDAAIRAVNELQEEHIVSEITDTLHKIDDRVRKLSDIDRIAKQLSQIEQRISSLQNRKETFTFFGSEFNSSVFYPTVLYLLLGILLAVAFDIIVR